MIKIVIAAISLSALLLSSCVVVMDDDGHHDKKNTDADTITIISSNAPTGIVASVK